MPSNRNSVNEADAQPDGNVFTATGSNYFDISHKQALDITKFTLGAWFKTSHDYSNDIGFIANKGGFGTTSTSTREDSGFNLNYGLWMEKNKNGDGNANKLSGGFESSDGTNHFVRSSAKYNDGKWHYAVLTYDSLALRLFVDGSQVASMTTNAVPDNKGTQPLRLATDSQYQGSTIKPSRFTGQIDDVRLWHVAVSFTEISRQFTSGLYDLHNLEVYMNGVSANYIPNAKAGADKSVSGGTTVKLDGSSSFDPDGSISSFYWKQIAGSPTVSIGGANGAVATFTAPNTSTALTFRLTVVDNKGASGIDEDVIAINAGANQLPVANAGPNQSINEGSQVTLDGSGSSDPDHSPQSLTFSWQQELGPTVSLSNPAASKPTFTAPQVSSDTTLRFKLTANDGAGTSTDSVDITVKNVASGGGSYHYAPAYSFSGSNYEEVMDSNSLQLTRFSIAAWFQTSIDYTNAGKPLLVNKGGFGPEGPGQNMNYGIWLENGATNANKIAAGFESSSGSDFIIVSPNRYNDGNWHYALTTYDGATLRLYVDGIQVSSLSTSATPDNAGDRPIRVGANSWDNTRFFTGNIDEVRVWNRALSSSEASDQFAGIIHSQGQVVYIDGATTVNYPSANKVLMTRGVAPSGEPNYRDDIASSIANARHYIYASMFYVEAYSGSPVINNLQLAVQRGVDVRLIIAPQSVQQYPSIEADLQAKGIPYKIVDDHSKVVVIDDKFAFVGSANWNKNGLEGNWEMTLKTNNPRTIAEAKQYNLNFWNGAQRAPVLNGYTDENFVSGSEYVDLLINKLKVASSVKVLMFEATYDFNNQAAAESRMLNEVKNAYQRGANLELLLDDPRYCVNFGGQQFLLENNIPHKLDDKNSGSFERVHAKAILIDNKYLFIGSQNWNRDSIDSILEATIMTTNTETINAFKPIFDAKWNLGKFRSDYNPCTTNFSIAASPTSLSIPAGQTGASTITVTSISGFNSGVTLSAAPIIPGVTYSFSPNPITPPVAGTASSTFSISTASNATKGTYAVTVTGATSSTPQHKVTITVTIT